MSFWRGRALWLGVCVIALLAAMPRLYAVADMTAFVDEVYWLSDGHEALQRWRNPDPSGDIWGPRILRHPGVPAAIPAGLAEDTRDLTADRVDENERILRLARLGIVWTGILCCCALVVLGARIYGLPTGLLAGAVLAVSPHHIANSAWLQCDSALALFSIISVLAWVLHLREGGWRWLLLSAVAAGLAVASKLPGVLLAPFVLAAYGLAWATGAGPPGRISLRRVVSELGAWGALALATLYLAWPRMWANPMELIDTLRWAISLGGGHLNYFMGAITNAPPWYYYLVVMPLSLGEVEWLGLLAAGGWWVHATRQGQRMRPETLLIIGWAVLFLLAMSFGGKKLGARYVLPLWPVLALVVARVAVLLAPHLARMRKPIPQMTLGACIGAALISLVATGGDFFAHANRLLGGLATMNRATLVVGVAELEVARRVDALADATQVQIAGHLLSVQWHARRMLEEAPCQGLAAGAAVPAGPQYLVVFSHFEQRCPAYAAAELRRRGMQEVQAVLRGGVPLARIYRMPD